MRFSIAYYLLLVYLSVMLKPLMPLVTDAWNHAFAEANHIATVHAKYGEHHLEKELASDEQNDNNKSQNTAKTTEPVPVHIAGEAYAQKLTVLTVPNHYPIFTSNILITPVPASPGQPPKYVL
jgi:hypothetical protein